MQNKTDKIIDIASAGADERRHTRREAKVKGLKRRLASARHASEAKSKAVKRLKNPFKKSSR